MSFLISPSSSFVFGITNPAQLATALGPGGGLTKPAGSPPATVTSNQPVALEGIELTYNTQPSSGKSQILITGQRTQVNTTGPADIQVTNSGGGGAVVNSNGFTDKGVKTINLTNAFSNPNPINAADPAVSVSVDPDAPVFGYNSSSPNALITVREAAADQGGTWSGDQSPFLFYAAGGSGKDLIVGSGSSDFLRGGAGDDRLNAGGGDDLVNGEAGNDQMELGLGEDTVYYSVNALTKSKDKLLDFTTGVDLISLDNVGFKNIKGYGSKKLTIKTNSGESITITSENTVINASDVFFINPSSSSSFI